MTKQGFKDWLEEHKIEYTDSDTMMNNLNDTIYVSLVDGDYIRVSGLKDDGDYSIFYVRLNGICDYLPEQVIKELILGEI